MNKKTPIDKEPRIIFKVLMKDVDAKGQTAIKIFTDDQIAKDHPLFLYRILLNAAKSLEGPALVQLRQEQTEKSKIEIIPGNAHIDRSTKPR